MTQLPIHYPTLIERLTRPRDPLPPKQCKQIAEHFRRQADRDYKTMKTKRAK